MYDAIDAIDRLLSACMSPTDRMVVADALDDLGRSGEAATCRNLASPLTIRDGRIVVPRPKPRTFQIVTYRSRYSRVVEGRLHVEADSRKEALNLMRAMAAVASAPVHSAAHHIARLVVSGTVRVTAYVDESSTYAAKDGAWRQWSNGEAREYARWDSCK